MENSSDKASSSESAVIFDPPPSNSTVLEGGTAAFTCVPKAEDGSIINALWVIDPVVSSSVTVFPGNFTPLPGADLVILSTNRTQLTITGVQRSLDGAGVLCRGSSQATGQVSAPLVYIVVQRPPNFTLPELSRDVLEGQALNLTLENVDFGNSEGAVSVLFEGRVLTEGNGFTVSRSGSTWSLEFPALNRSDAGVYRVLLRNTVGSSGMNFTVNVVYPPELTFPTVRSIQLNRGSLFAFDCTASAAKPSSVDYSFRKDGSSQPFSESGSVLTISSVVRANTGNYSCTATNTAGSTTLYHNLLVVAPPTSPLNLIVSREMAFSAMVTWTPPTDDGGISHPSWTPPSPSSSPIIQYTVTYSNSSGSWSINNLNTSLVTLSNLQHSTAYTVTVAASNAHGQSTGVQGTFRTLDSKPIFYALELNVLSLSSFTVNITFLTVGGQSVSSISVQLNGGSSITYTQQVWDGKMVELSLLVRSQNFAPGTNYSVSVTATSNAGTSDPIIGVLHVPNPPNITAPPTELSPSSHSPCCSAVKLNLAEPGGVSSVGVSLSTGGGPFKIVDSGDVSLDGDVLYVSGLQAGAVYVAKIDVSNAIGSSSTLKALVPLLGAPSAPTMVIVAADTYTSVSVVMATSHPGTFTGRIDNMLLFQVQILKNGLFLRTELVTATAFIFNVTTATYNGILDPGSYSVRVTAVNEYGQSTAVMSKEFTLEDSSQVTTIVLAVIVVVLSLALLAVCVYSVVVTVKRKHGFSWNPPQQMVKSEPVYAGIEMESRPVDSELKMESNPAYSTTEGVKKATSNKTKDQTISGAGGEVEYEAIEVTK